MRVLLVEDDPDHAELVRRGLEEYRSRLELSHIADGESALAYLKERAPRSTPGRPHLILLDLRLPRMDGLEVLREIKAAPDLSDIPCVVLTTVSVAPVNHLNGVPTLDTCREQVDAYATTYAGARAVADACRVALEAGGLEMENEIDLSEPDVSEYRITQD